MPRHSKRQRTRNNSVIRSALYLRCSTDQQDTSCGDQETTVKRWLKRQPEKRKVVATCVDDGVSGWDTSKERAGFEQALELARTGKIDEILVWHHDRFSRADIPTFLEQLLMLHRHGVKLRPINDVDAYDATDPISLMRAIMTHHGAHEFSEEQSRKVRRGQLERARAGKWMAGKPPVGYSIDEETGKLRKVESEAKLVRRIFKLYAGGESIRAIARQLNGEGILNPDRNRKLKKRNAPNRWGKETVRGILQNETYRGTFSYETTDGDTGEIELVNLPGNHPAIVDARTWATVRRLMEANSKPRFRAPAERGTYPLQGLVVCGHCGGPMYRRVSGHYKCEAHRDGLCSGASIREDEATAAVVRKIVDYYSSDAKLDAIRDLYRQDLSDAAAQDPAELDDELARMRDEHAAAVDAITYYLINTADKSPDILKALEDKKRACESRIEELGKAIAAASTPARVRRQQEDETIDAYLSTFRRLDEVYQHGNPAELQALLRAMLVAIEVFCKPRPLSAKRTAHDVTKVRFYVRESGGHNDPRRPETPSFIDENGDVTSSPNLTGAHMPDGQVRVLEIIERLDEYYTFAEALDALEIHRRTLTRWINTGKIEVQRRGQFAFFHPDEIDRLRP